MPFTPTSLEWRMLAGACEALAVQERQRARGVAERAAQDYLNSAREFERLAERCLRMAKP